MKALYKVVGASAFQGHQPGEEFEADLDEQLERRAKERGQIHVVKRNPEHDKQEKEAETDA